MEHRKIQEVIENLLKQMNVVFEAVEYVESPESKHTRFLIRTGDSALLIGSKGEHLGAFNYIARRIVSKMSGEEAPVKFFVDVNGYHEKTLETLKAKARVMSERARTFQVDVELEPMSPYERMLIHSYLEGSPDIKTESKGDGMARRIVIKYVAP